MITQNGIRERGVQPPTAEQLRRWSDMTAANQHREARISIARYFGDKERQEVFQWLKDKRDRNERITHADMCLSSDVTAGMIADIAAVFGDETARKVNMCL